MMLMMQHKSVLFSSNQFPDSSCMLQLSTIYRSIGIVEILIKREKKCDGQDRERL